MTEGADRLANLDVAPDFAPRRRSWRAAGGRRHRAGLRPHLLLPDRGGFQPRSAWPGVRFPDRRWWFARGMASIATPNVYQSLALLLAQQPPLSTTFSVDHEPRTPLTLANGFIGRRRDALNTFAIDPDFRVGFAQNWQASAQRDLPASLTVIGDLSRLARQPADAAVPAEHVSRRRRQSVSGVSGRLRLPDVRPDARSATPDRSSCGAACATASRRPSHTRWPRPPTTRRRSRAPRSTGAAVAQDWLDLDAEYARSNFDQRHLFVAQVQYTTGVRRRRGRAAGRAEGHVSSRAGR